MTIRDQLTTPILWLIILQLFFVGYVAFASGSLVTAWDVRDNPPAQFIEPTQWAQVGFRGTFGGEL